jgi:hypothetical protein
MVRLLGAGTSGRRSALSVVMDDVPPRATNRARSRAAAGDDELLARARADGAAFVAVFERHGAPLFRFAAHRVGAAAVERSAPGSRGTRGSP